MVGIIDAVLVKRDEIEQDLAVFTFNPSKIVSFLPGQFMTLGVHDPVIKQMRAFSIASSPSKQELEFLIKKTKDGVLTPILYDLKVGDVVRMVGPSGSFVLGDEKNVVFISAGAGIAPFMSMCRVLVQKGFDSLQFIHGNSYESGLAYREELQEYSLLDGFTYVPTLSRKSKSWTGEKGRAEAVADRLVEKSDAAVYICGPPEMVANTQRVLKKKGFTDSQLKKEEW